MKFDTEFPNAREGCFVPAGFATTEQIADCAVLAEQLGYHAVWATDFISPTQTYNVPADEAPDWYEPLITLAYVAARTQRIKLGTGLLMAPYRDPLILAKQVATLDCMSDGRMLLGLGLGMCRDEFLQARPRVHKANRGRMLDESIGLLQRFFSDEESVTHEGEYYAVRGMTLNPKPLQRPLPIYVPGKTPDAIERIARHGLGMTLPNSIVLRWRAELEALLATYGRTLAEIDIIAEGEILIDDSHEAAVAAYQNTRHGRFRLSRQPLEQVLAGNWIGTAGEIIEKIGRLREQGVDHFTLLHIPGDSLSARHEQMHRFAETVVPAVRDIAPSVR